MKRNKRNRHSKPYMPKEEEMKRILDGLKEQPFFKDAFIQKEEAKQPVGCMGNGFEAMVVMLLIAFLLSPSPFPFHK